MKIQKERENKLEDIKLQSKFRRTKIKKAPGPCGILGETKLLEEDDMGREKNPKLMRLLLQDDKSFDRRKQQIEYGESNKVFETDNLRKIIQKNAKQAASKIEDRIRLAKDYLKRKQMASRGLKIREGVDSLMATQKEDHSSVNDFEVFKQRKIEKARNATQDPLNPL